MHQLNMKFNFIDLAELRDKNLIINGHQGGLLLGPSHAEGGIPMLWLYNEGALLKAELQGLEYFMNAGASVYFHKEIDQMNAKFISQHDSKTVVNYKKHRTLGCRVPNSNKSKYLMVDARCRNWIVNRRATFEYIERLEEMNSKIKGELTGKFLTWDD